MNELEVKCPQCANDDPTSILGVDVIQVLDDPADESWYECFPQIAGFREDGSIDYEGYTRIEDVPGKPDYDGQKSTYGPGGHIMLLCQSCGNRWEEPKLTGESRAARGEAA